MNVLLSVVVIIILPAGGWFSFPVLYVFLFYLFFLILSCSEQSAARLLIRAVGQSLGIAAVCSALCSLKVLPVEEKGAPHVCLTIAIPLSWEWRCSCGGEWGGSWLQRSSHPVGKLLLPCPNFHSLVSGTIWEQNSDMPHCSRRLDRTSPTLWWPLSSPGLISVWA